jgi:glycosyltransferase involved in cell wall biosynthesis
MKISIIIPTYNESTVIKDCLESLSKQSYKDFEIIVVDDGSSDDSLEVVKSQQTSNLHNLQLYSQEHRGPGAARNLGAKKATGEILVFVDADMTFDKHFLKNLVKPIILGKSKGTFSKEEYVSNWENVWARAWNINQNWEEKRRHPKNYSDKQKVFRAILKSEFDKVGGFTPGGYTDDYSLYTKLGYMATSAPGAIFYHKNPSTLAEVFGQARWASKREYKLGSIGYVVGVVRASLPVSLVVGFFESIVNAQPAFLAFKIVYDFGVFIGILEMVLTGKRIK